MTKILCFVLLAMFCLSSDACKCRVLEDPGYCRTDFLALLKVTAAKIYEGQKIYSFEIIRDLTRPSKGHTLKEFTTIKTNSEPAACGVYLEVGQFYLLGGSLERYAQTNITIPFPYLYSCRAYVEWWDNQTRSPMELDKHEQRCEQFDASGH